MTIGGHGKPESNSGCRGSLAGRPYSIRQISIWPKSDQAAAFLRSSLSDISNNRARIAFDAPLFLCEHCGKSLKPHIVFGRDNVVEGSLYVGNEGQHLHLRHDAVARRLSDFQTIREIAVAEAEALTEMPAASASASWESPCRARCFRTTALNEKGPSPFEPGPSSHVAVKLFLDLRLPRPCRRPIAFTETLAASANPPLDKTRS